MIINSSLYSSCACSLVSALLCWCDYPPPSPSNSRTHRPIFSLFYSICYLLCLPPSSYLIGSVLSHFIGWMIGLVLADQYSLLFHCSSWCVVWSWYLSLAVNSRSIWFMVCSFSIISLGRLTCSAATPCWTSPYFTMILYSSHCSACGTSPLIGTIPYFGLPTPSTCAAIPAQCSNWLWWLYDHPNAIAPITPRCWLLSYTIQRKDWPSCPQTLWFIAVRCDSCYSEDTQSHSEVDSSIIQDLLSFD